MGRFGCGRTAKDERSEVYLSFVRAELIPERCERPGGGTTDASTRHTSKVYRGMPSSESVRVPLPNMKTASFSVDGGSPLPAGL